MTGPDGGLGPPGEPAGDPPAERAARADRATRGALAAVLCLEAFVVLLVPRGIAHTSGGLGGVRTGILIGLAVVMVGAAAIQRRSWGVAAGSALQLAFLATGVLLAAMFVIGIIFVSLWIYLLNLRRELVGTPGGVRMFLS